MLKYAEDFKHNPQLRDKVSELRLSVDQEGEEEMLAMVDLDQWYVYLSFCLYVCVCLSDSLLCVCLYVCVCACVCVCVCTYMCGCERHKCISLYLHVFYELQSMMLPQTHKTPSHKAARRTSLAFDNIDTRDMAHTLAYLDFKLFRRISVSLLLYKAYAIVCKES